MMTGAQLRAARALLAIDQKTLALLAGVSVPTVQRMEASGGTVRGIVESLTRIVAALDRAGVELIGEGAASAAGGRGVRLKADAPATSATPAATAAAPAGAAAPAAPAATAAPTVAAGAPADEPR